MHGDHLVIAGDATNINIIVTVTSYCYKHP